MTIRELYNWALVENTTDFDIIIQHRDEGGCYSTVDKEIEPLINRKENTVTL